MLQIYLSCSQKNTFVKKVLSELERFPLYFYVKIFADFEVLVLHFPSLYLYMNVFKRFFMNKKNAFYDVFGNTTD